MTTSKTKKIKAKDFDQAFESDDVIEHLDLKSVKAQYLVRQISIDFTKNILDEVDCQLLIMKNCFPTPSTFTHIYSNLRASHLTK